MDWKNCHLTEIKMDASGEGTFEAIFARMNVIDHDMDVTLNGAFGNQKVVISQYNHGSWGKGADALPIGVGEIFESGDNAIVRGEFDMNDADAVKTYNKLKYLNEKGRNVEWSYALPEIKASFGQFTGVNVRFLEKIRVPEACPVLMGAGIGTELLSIKNMGMPLTEHFEVVHVAIDKLVERLKSLGELRAKDGRHPSEATMKSAAKIKIQLLELVGQLEENQEQHDAAYAEYLRYHQIIQHRRS